MNNKTILTTNFDDNKDTLLSSLNNSTTSSILAHHQKLKEINKNIDTLNQYVQFLRKESTLYLIQKCIKNNAAIFERVGTFFVDEHSSQNNPRVQPWPKNNVVDPDRASVILESERVLDKIFGQHFQNDQHLFLAKIGTIDVHNFGKHVKKFYDQHPQFLIMREQLNCNKVVETSTEPKKTTRTKTL